MSVTFTAIRFQFIFTCLLFFLGKREWGKQEELVENLLFALFDLLSWATEGALHFTLFALPASRRTAERGEEIGPFSYQLVFYA